MPKKKVSPSLKGFLENSFGRKAHAEKFGREQNKHVLKTAMKKRWGKK